MKGRGSIGIVVACLAAALAGCSTERTTGSPDGVMHQNTDSYTNYETPSRNYFGGGGADPEVCKPSRDRNY
jgi:hypothetical protein